MQPRAGSGLLGLENLLAAIHAGLEIDVMRTAQLARILVLDIGGGSDRIGGAAESAFHRRSLAFWNGHFGLRIWARAGIGRRQQTGVCWELAGSIEKK